MALKDIRTIVRETRKQIKLKRQIKERKKDVSVVQRHLGGGKIIAGEEPRLRRVLQERERRNRASKFQ